MGFSIDHWIQGWVQWLVGHYTWAKGGVLELFQHPLTRQVLFMVAVILACDLARGLMKATFRVFTVKRFSIFWLTGKMSRRLGWWMLMPGSWLMVLFTLVLDIILLPVEILACFGLRFDLKQKFLNLSRRIWGRDKFEVEEDSTVERVEVHHRTFSIAGQQSAEENSAPPAQNRRIVDRKALVEQWSNGLPKRSGTVVYLDDGTQLWDGPLTEYFDSGRAQSHGIMSMGKKVKGTWRYYDTAGREVRGG